MQCYSQLFSSFSFVLALRHRHAFSMNGMAIIMWMPSYTLALANKFINFNYFWLFYYFSWSSSMPHWTFAFIVWFLVDIVHCLGNLWNDLALEKGKIFFGLGQPPQNSMHKIMRTAIQAVLGQAKMRKIYNNYNHSYNWIWWEKIDFTDKSLYPMDESPSIK